MLHWFCPYSRKCVLLLQYFHLIHDVVLAYICTHIRSFCHCPILSLIPHSHFSYEILDYGECYKICSKIEITKNIFFAIYQIRVGHSSTDKLTWLYYIKYFITLTTTLKRFAFKTIALIAIYSAVAFATTFYEFVAWIRCFYKLPSSHPQQI